MSSNIEQQPLYSHSPSQEEHDDGDAEIDNNTQTHPHAPIHHSLSTQVDPANNRFPFCLVWGPLPLITWICPWIGHLGIGDSTGAIHDFSGPYSITISDFMTPAWKYVQLPPSVWTGHEHEWDGGIAEADACYRKRMHNLCADNCHHHSAMALRRMNIASGHHGSDGDKLVASLRHFSMFQAWWLITSQGKFVSTGAWIATYLPFLLGLFFWIYVLTAFI